MKKYFLSAFFLLLVSIPQNGYAWGKKGHALVAEVAFNYLDPTTKKSTY